MGILDILGIHGTHKEGREARHAAMNAAGFEPEPGRPSLGQSVAIKFEQGKGRLKQAVVPIDVVARRPDYSFDGVQTTKKQVHIPSGIALAFRAKPRVVKTQTTLDDGAIEFHHNQSENRQFWNATRLRDEVWKDFLAGQGQKMNAAQLEEVKLELNAMTNDELLKQFGGSQYFADDRYATSLMHIDPEDW